MNSKPIYSMLYDRFAEEQNRRAIATYISLLPAISRSTQVTDTLMLDQLAIAERTLNSFSAAFGLVDQFGNDMQDVCRNAACRDSAELSHITSVFTYLQALLNHPAFVMLTTVASIADRRKPVAVMRDIRWIFKPESDGLILKNVEKFFVELTSGLLTIMAQLKDYPMNTQATTAVIDCIGFIKDEQGTILINAVNFGTAAALTQSAVECARRR